MKFPRLTTAALCSLLSLTSLLAGCGTISNLKAKHALKKQQKALEKASKLAEEEKAKPAIATAVGEVSYVDEESGFILIRQYVGRKIAPNTALVSRGRASATAKLMSNPAAKGSFVVADILSGLPQKGDAVLTDVDAKTTPVTPLMPIPAGQTSPGAASGTNPLAVPGRVPPPMDPLLPPLDPLQPPSGDVTVPPLPQ